MRTALVLVTGIDPRTMASTMVSLQFDLPETIAVTYAIAADRRVLRRSISDVAAVRQTDELDLTGECVCCAVRMDLLSVLSRLVQDGAPQSVLVHLPATVEARQICAEVSRDRGLARLLRVSAVVAALDSRDPVEDLLGPDLLAERGLQSAPEDRRGVGEVLASMIEHSDLVVFDETATPLAEGLVRTIAHPGAAMVDQPSALDSESVVADLHHQVRTREWTDPARSGDLRVTPSCVWQIDLRTDRPFHPEWLLDSIGRLGAGAHRSRGCFWLPTRPGRLLEWDGAGGQLSIGQYGWWRNRAPFTRIVLTGVGDAPTHIRDAFDDLILPVDASTDWRVAEDGYEPWLGPIQQVA